MVLPVNKRDFEQLLLGPLLDRGSRLQPDNLIITKTRNGYHTQTYLEHQRRTKHLASALYKQGVQLEDRVATLMWNSGWHLECYHAIPCMGAVLHTLNLRLGPADLGYIIQHAQDRIIIADFDMLKLLAQVDGPMLKSVELLVCVSEDAAAGHWELPAGLSSLKAVDYEEFLKFGDEEFPWPHFAETTTMGLCYTSGTTGKPKGVSYSHRSTYLHTLVAAQGDQLCLRGYEVVLPFVPMFHVLSWGTPFALMMGGVRTVLTSRYMDPANMVKMFSDWKVNLSTGVPTVWQGVRQYIEQQGLDAMRPHLVNLKRLTCGGSAPQPELMRWFLQQLNVEFLQGWGMTETNPMGSIGQRVAKYADLSKSEEETFKNVTKAGLPNPCIHVRIADTEDLSRELPRGQAGELLVRGPWEYFQADAPDKFYDGWLVTGDVAKIDEEGAIVISDRSKDVIKSGGEWISSIDMENQRLGASELQRERRIAAMGSIASAAVVAVPHPKWDERPIAVVTLAKGPVPDLLAKARRKQDLGFGMAREVDRGTKVG
ncbi:Long-chain-fatty-acid--CoA ligase (Long-chain fatty acyl-CoA synthetase) (LC-FACS) [Durusdinium trenchii]|uniref:Long-chain-fatty-acid--CoA ligase (Long-chain fatty acyl-CoA synthetase) (LC-FACS) n=1 Tax=Durusdinium trenchii TaxID=1381693 RepID=A0ABP0QDN4_9DINO